MTPCPRCGRGIDELVECPGCHLRFEVWIDRPPASSQSDVLHVHVVYDEDG